jgi:hypothetical protein
MSNADNDRVRKLQDDFLSLPGVRRWLAGHGQDTPLWLHGPTARQLRESLLPQWTAALRTFLRRRPVTMTPAKPTPMPAKPTPMPDPTSPPGQEPSAAGGGPEPQCPPDRHDPVREARGLIAAAHERIEARNTVLDDCRVCRTLVLLEIAEELLGNYLRDRDKEEAQKEAGAPPAEPGGPE